MLKKFVAVLKVVFWIGIAIDIIALIDLVSDNSNIFFKTPMTFLAHYTVIIFAMVCAIIAFFLVIRALETKL